MDLADHGCIAPSMLEEISKIPRILHKMRKWSSVAWGSAPLAKSAGDVLSQYTLICDCLAASETFTSPSLVQKNKEDWCYHEFHPFNGMKLEVRDDGFGEAVYVRDSALERFQPVFATFPELRVFHTQDLFLPHPETPGLWRYVGRDSDVLVLSNGENLMPTGMEGIISATTGVISALIVGHGRFQAALLVELDDEHRMLSESDKMALIQTSVYKANAIAPGFGKIGRSYIKFLKPGESFKKTGKGTIQRRPTIQALESEIDKLYNEAQNQANALSLDFSQDSRLQESVLATLQALSASVSSISLDDDIFSYGVDSLQTQHLARDLSKSLELHGMDPFSTVTPSVVYANPTARQLTKKILGLISPMHDEVEAMREDDELLKKYVDQLKQALRGIPILETVERRAESYTVMLTGSTGSLGSYLLHEILQLDKVSKVYCLNRSTTGKKRQNDSFAAKGLTSQLDSPRVEFLHVDLASKQLGLDKIIYQKLLSEATHVLHNAWPVDFNHALQSFEPHLRGCINLAEFASRSQHSSQIFFISSVAAVSRDRSPIPEAPASGIGATSDAGYGKSKLIAETLFQCAAETNKVKCKICRVGQIAGPVLSNEGMWNRREWVPSLIASSHFLGRLPSGLSGLDRVDWIPVDLLAQVVCQLTFDADMLDAATADRTVFLHAVNPAKSTWKDTLTTIQKRFPGIAIVEYSDWLGALKESARNATVDLEKNPAVKLLDFFCSLEGSLPMPEFDTSVSAKNSSVLKEMKPVDEAWINKWMDQWDY